MAAAELVARMLLFFCSLTSVHSPPVGSVIEVVDAMRDVMQATSRSPACSVPADAGGDQRVRGGGDLDVVGDADKFPSHSYGDAVYVRLVIETCWPAEMTTLLSVMSPPPPVAVTEHSTIAVPPPWRSSALATVPPVALLSAVIAAAVATPLDAAPNAGLENVKCGNLGAARGLQDDRAGRRVEIDLVDHIVRNAGADCGAVCDRHSYSLPITLAAGPPNSTSPSTIHCGISSISLRSPGRVS